MAIIKCPECGHEVSDKAPVCPSCGVEIAGHIIKCSECGTAYFSYIASCPYCHAVNRSQDFFPRLTPTGIPEVAPRRKSSNRLGFRVWFLSFLTAFVLVAVGIVVWYVARSDKEEEAYAYAYTSSDPAVLQTYLDTYGSAPEEHRDSIEAHLKILQLSDTEWANALASRSVTAMQAYVGKYPQSIHLQEAMHVIDSIDWATAQRQNTFDAYQKYIDNHAEGEHIDEANTALQESQARTVMPDEKDDIVTLFRNFFQNISARNEAGLKSTVALFLDSFLGKNDAAPSDVVTFMKKIYKEDIVSMDWHLNNDFMIDKKKTGEGQFEYIVQFSVLQNVERTGGGSDKPVRYLVKAKVDSDHLISSFNLTKILQ